MEQIELPIQIDRDLPGSLAAKIVMSLRHAIETGMLRSGDVLPPTRELALRLGVSRGTIVSAYEQLSAEGYFESGQGVGTRVNPDLTDLHGQQIRSHQRPPSPQSDHPSRAQPKPIADLSLRPAWRAAWRKAASSERLGREMQASGDPELLHEIAEHLRTMRGMLRGRSDVLVTAGAREGLGLILTALGTTTGRKLVVGVEEHGPSSLSEVAYRHGAQVVALPTDEEGLLAEALPNALLDAIIITPSFQYPRGGMMSLQRRQELIAWAKTTGVTVIEDDFDSELRYSNAPLPTLAALDDPDDGVVAMLGSYSVTLSITLAAGFLVVPKRLHEILMPVRRDLGCPVSPVLQIALTELLTSGELRLHVARLRRARQRRETIDEFTK